VNFLRQLPEIISTGNCHVFCLLPLVPGLGLGTAVLRLLPHGLLLFSWFGRQIFERQILGDQSPNPSHRDGRVPDGSPSEEAGLLHYGGVGVENQLLRPRYLIKFDARLRLELTVGDGYLIKPDATVVTWHVMSALGFDA